MSESLIRKVILGSIGALGFMLILFIPVFAIVGSVIEPFKMVGDMIAQIGDFMVPDDTYTNDAFIVIDQYFQYGNGYDMLASVYKPTIKAYEDLVYVPDNYLFIPNILIGNEDPSNELIELMHSLAYDSWTEEEPVIDEETGEQAIDEDTGEPLFELVEYAELVDTNEYCRRIKNIEPFASKLNIISSGTLANYVNHFSYIAGKPGLNDEYVAHNVNAQGWIYPFASHFPITAGIGYYDPFGKVEMHNGVDFGAGCGEAIYCVKGGTVISISKSASAATGYSVTIATDDGYTVLYAHMSTPYVGNIGDYVSTGDYIGPVGNTGKATGCHLHLRLDKGNSIVDFTDIVDCN